mgnify:CR=1 FL=1
MNQKSTSAPIAENKMGTMPVNRLLLSMSIPIMISMLVQALYNVVDSIFVAQLSEDALNAVSLAFPIQNLMISVAVGTGVGINALLSRSLGEKNYDAANRAAENGVRVTGLSAYYHTAPANPQTAFVISYSEIPDACITEAVNRLAKAVTAAVMGER